LGGKGEGCSGSAQRSDNPSFLQRLFVHGEKVQKFAGEERASALHWPGLLARSHAFFPPVSRVKFS